MISELTGIRNFNILVFFDYALKTVCVQSTSTGEYTCFVEFADMEMLFNDFKEHFSEDIDYETALLFFKPNIAE